MQVLIRETAAHIDFAHSPLIWGPTDLKNRITTANFVFESNLNPSITSVPVVGDDVRIVDDGGTTTLYFGHIAQVERGGDPINRRYAIACQDLNYLFDLLRLPSDCVIPAGYSDDAMVHTLFGQYTYNGWSSGPTTMSVANILGVFVPWQNFVAKATNLPALTVTAGTTLAQGLNAIGALAGGVDWFVDSTRTFHWNDVGGLASLVLTSESPDNWPLKAVYYYNYREFIDRTQHYHRVKVNNAGAYSATADNWAAYADQRLSQLYEWQSDGTNNNERLLEAAPISDSSLTSQTAVTQRAYGELDKGRIRRTVRLTIDRPDHSVPLLYTGQLVDIVNGTWGDADIGPIPSISREAPTHSNIRGELMPGSRGRYLIQRITPRLLTISGAKSFFACDLELGDYEGSLAATLAKL